MADLDGGQVIHGNYGLVRFDGKVIGRVKNVTMVVDGASSEFYEMGSAWLQELEVINRKVNVTVEKGAINYLLLTYAAGAFTRSGGFRNDDDGTYNLMVNNVGEFEITLRENDEIVSSPFTVDIEIVATKIDANGQLRRITATAFDCKVIRSNVDAPQDDFWSASMELIGKQFAVTSELTPLTIS